MAINSVKIVYFSPTRTTRKVIEGIAIGMGVVDVEHLDLTRMCILLTNGE